MASVEELRQELAAMDALLKERRDADRGLRKRWTEKARELSVAEGTHFVVLYCHIVRENDRQDWVEIWGVGADATTKARGLQFSVIEDQVFVKLSFMDGDTITMALGWDSDPLSFKLQEGEFGWTTQYTIVSYKDLAWAEEFAIRLRKHLAESLN